MSIVSLDLETTGLDERIHEAWEVALVTDDGHECCWQFPIRKHRRDFSPEALEISGFYERKIDHGLPPYPALLFEAGEIVDEAYPRFAATALAGWTEGATLMGCAISFDMRFLAELMRAYDVEPRWHHRGLDLGSYAAGRLGAAEPLSSKQMTASVPNEGRHTALGDARWNWAMYRHLRSPVFGPQS